MTGYEALRSQAAWLNLSTRGKIRVNGEDRARLLHAMSTNHIEQLQPGSGVYAFFLNAQGRILGDAYIYAFADSLLLDTEPESAAKLLAHLDHYIIADDVTLEDETTQETCIAIEGPRSDEVAGQLEISLPPAAYSVAHWQKGFAARSASSASTGFRIFLPQGDEPSLLKQLEDLNVPEASPAEAKIVRLENGIPRYGEDITERYLVQETRSVHALHPNKGCYLGQEIVERVRSRAQIHRTLLPVRIKSSSAPGAGTKLTADGKPAAEITSAAYSPALGKVVALAYVRTEAAEAKPPLLVADADPPVEAYIP